MTEITVEMVKSGVGEGGGAKLDYDKSNVGRAGNIMFFFGGGGGWELVRLFLVVFFQLQIVAIRNSQICDLMTQIQYVKFNVHFI